MFYVDGIECDEMDHALVLAERLFNRYGGYRTITIVNSDGDVCNRIDAKRFYDDQSENDNIDWIDS